MNSSLLGLLLFLQNRYCCRTTSKYLSERNGKIWGVENSEKLMRFSTFWNAFHSISDNVNN